MQQGINIAVHTMYPKYSNRFSDIYGVKEFIKLSMVKLSGYCYVLELASILESFSIVYRGRAGKRGDKMPKMYQFLNFHRPTLFQVEE